MNAITTSTQFAQDVPALLTAQASWPVGTPVCVKQKKTGNVLATGNVTSSSSGSVVVTIDRRFD